MQIRTLSPALSVSDQITPGDVATIAAAGFRSIICNRPDGEAPDQADFATIEAAAREAGLAAMHQPVVSGQVNPADGDAFRVLMDTLPKPVFAYCRSGARCTTLFTLANTPSGATR